MYCGPIKQKLYDDASKCHKKLPVIHLVYGLQTVYVSDHSLHIHSVAAYA